MAIQYSIQKMVSDGTLSTIALGIQYLQRNDIYMRIAGEETPQSGAPSGYTWSFINNTTLKILPVVPNGVEVVVYRRTDVDAMYNVYSQNAQFDEATIDENNQQLLYIAQEYLEQGIPGAGVDTLEFVRDDGTYTYYRIKRTDGSYSDEFAVPSAGSAAKIFAREALRRSYAEAGYNVVDGSFEVGGTVNAVADALLYEATGVAYSWGGALPKTIPANSTPASTGGMSASGWLSLEGITLRSDLASPPGAALVGFSHEVIYPAASLGFRLKNAIDITDAPYNARPDGSNIRGALEAALNTGRPVYIPDTGTEFFRVSGKVWVTAAATLHGPTTARLVLDGLDAEDNHIVFNGPSAAVYGLTLESMTRGTPIRVYPSSVDCDRVEVIGTRMRGYFYAVKCGRDPDPGVRTVRNITVAHCDLEAATSGNAGHLQATQCGFVKYLYNRAKGGQNSSVYGLSQVQYFVIHGNIQTDLADTINDVEAGIEIEDCGASRGVVSSNICDHDIWVASSSDVVVANNVCRSLRMSVGNPEAGGIQNVTWQSNIAGRIHIDRFSISDPGFYMSADFENNKLVPNNYLWQGAPIQEAVYIGNNAAGINFRNHQQGDAAVNGFKILRNPQLVLRISGDSYLGSKPHLLTGYGGKIIQGKSVTPPIGAIASQFGVADLQLGLFADHVVASAGAWVKVPLTALVDLNAQFNDTNDTFTVQAPVGAFEVEVTITVTSTAAGVDIGARLYNYTTATEVWRVGFVTSQKATINSIGGSRVLGLTPGDTYGLEVFTSVAGQTVAKGNATSRLTVNRKL